VFYYTPKTLQKLDRYHQKKANHGSNRKTYQNMLMARILQFSIRVRAKENFREKIRKDAKSINVTRNFAKKIPQKTVSVVAATLNCAKKTCGILCSESSALEVLLYHNK